MVEAVVQVIIGKLCMALVKEAAIYGASLLGKEASTLKGLFGEIRKAEEELNSMKSYLRESEKLKNTDEITGIFVKNIRELSFRIEDVVDEFMYSLEDNKHGGFLAKAKKRFKLVKIWHRLALELCSINAELKEASARRGRYTIPGNKRYGGGSVHDDISTNQFFCLPKQEDLVGIKDNVDKLTRCLVSDFMEKKCKIITVWGMGGVGKTTLVDHVYKIVKVNFDTAAWVTVAKSYQVEDLLKKIVRELGISVDTSNMDMRVVVGIIRNHLEGKTFILVLDDVWEDDVWIKIMDVFPTNCISRFVLTSRNHEVASLADTDCEIKVEPLGKGHSWELFCKLAFRSSDDKECPSELHDLAIKFLQKCEGLPIAIACIGRLLSCKPRSYIAWNNVYEELELQSTKNVIPGVDAILKVSLEDLPFYLRSCFLHCALFPEDSVMQRRMLIRQWITAGFIKEKDNKTLEEVAESCLNMLVNRSLLQVLSKNEFGRVKWCRMHDVIRHLALESADKECFGKVYDGSRSFLLDGTRRLSINSTNVAPLSQSSATHLRAINLFMTDINIDLLRPVLASSNFLSTLDLQGAQIEMLPKEVFSLFNLRFLGLRYTKIQILPESVGRLQNLEVLDALLTALQSLPKAVGTLKKLRYLYASKEFHTKGSSTHFGAIKVPRGIRNLTGLHALQYVKASLEILRDVATLAELRTFAVGDITSEHSLNLCTAIMNMRHLVHLLIAASNEHEVLPWEQLRLPETLSKLYLGGQLEKKWTPQIFSSWSHLNNLTRLSLRLSKLDEDSFSNLVVLRGLCYLRLLNKAYNGKKLHFPALSFPRLRQLKISGAPQLNQVEIAEGALESLIVLWFSDCPRLNMIPRGIEHLTALEILYLEDIAEELIEKLRWESGTNECNEEQNKISHIRKVVVVSTRENIWERIR